MKIQNRYMNTAEDKQKQRLNEKLRLAEYISNECRLNDFEKKEVKDIIKKIPNFKEICKKCSNEQIITVIALKTRKRYRKTNIQDFHMWKINELNWRRYSLILENMINYFYKHSYIR
jgi:superfamily II helicase